MKLLLDQNFSHRLVKQLQPFFTEVSQVRFIGLENATDKEIWTYAKENNYTIVTFDSDFYQYSIVWGHPPKIVWLITRAQSTVSIANLLISKQELIKLFIERSDLACLEIPPNR